MNGGSRTTRSIPIREYSSRFEDYEFTNPKDIDLKLADRADGDRRGVGRVRGESGQT